MEKDILIVGAGPAGLIAAKTLADVGLNATVIEMKKDMDKLTRACSQQFIIDDDYEDEILKVEEGKLHFLKCGLTVPYTGKLVPLYNKYYHSPKGHVIHFTRNDGKEPFSYKFDKQKMLKDLYELCLEKGVNFRMGTVAAGGKDTGDGVELLVKDADGEHILKGAKLLIGEGVNASLCGTFGMNEGRTQTATAMCLKNVVEGIKGIEDNSWNLFYGSVYHNGAAPIIGPSLEGDGIFEVTLTGDLRQRPAQVYEQFTKMSPAAPMFENAKVVKTMACSVAAFTPMTDPCKGNVIAIGDSAAMVEVETQGAFLCGYFAAKAVERELQGGDGFENYRKWWKRSFEFNGDDYMEVARGYALGVMYTDDELDYLFSLTEGHKLHGTYSQYLTPKLIWGCIHQYDMKIREERPLIYQKIMAMQ